MILFRSLLMMGLLLVSHGLSAAPVEAGGSATELVIGSQADANVNANTNAQPNSEDGVGSGLGPGRGSSLGPGMGSGMGSGMGPARHYLLQSMLILGGLLILLMGALKILRKGGHLKTQSGQRLKVVEAVSLGGSDRAVLVRVGNEEVLLGVSQGRVAPLMLVDPEASSSLAAAEQSDSNLNNPNQGAAMPGAGFSALISRLRS